MDPRDIPPPPRPLGRSPARQNSSAGKSGLKILQDLNTAKALGVEVPLSLLALADEVIE
jgi:hypothetical protein